MGISNHLSVGWLPPPRSYSRLQRSAPGGDVHVDFTRLRCIFRHSSRNDLLIVLET